MSASKFCDDAEKMGGVLVGIGIVAYLLAVVVVLIFAMVHLFSPPSVWAPDARHLCLAEQLTTGQAAGLIVLWGAAGGFLALFFDRVSE